MCSLTVLWNPNAETVEFSFCGKVRFKVVFKTEMLQIPVFFIVLENLYLKFKWREKKHYYWLLYSWRFSRYRAPIHWLVHCHMTSNNETVSRQMPWAGNIAKTMTSIGKQSTVTREMLTAVARHLSITWWLVFHRFDPFALLYNKPLNDWSLGEQGILFPSNLNVSLDFVSGHIEILGKQNSLFPSGPVNKCLILLERNFTVSCKQRVGLISSRYGSPVIYPPPNWCGARNAGSQNGWKSSQANVMYIAERDSIVFPFSDRWRLKVLQALKINAITF